METSISMADFYGKYQNENLELIDVREAHEFQAGPKIFHKYLRARLQRTQT